jgi:hypothetical protein
MSSDNTRRNEFANRWLDHHSPQARGRGTKATQKLWAAVIVAALIAGGFVYLGTSSGLFSGNQVPNNNGKGAQSGAALGSTTTIDVIVPSYASGWSAPYETVTQSASAFTSKNNYPAGTTFYLHVASTAGNKYYDALFGPFVAGGCGGSPQVCFTAAPTSSGGTVWGQAGQLGLFQEATGRGISYLLTNNLGASCGSAAGNLAQESPTHTAGHWGAVTGYMTLTVKLNASTASSVTNLGLPMPFPPSTQAPPGPPGPGTTTGRLVMWYATNQTSGNAWIEQNGFTPTSTQPYPNVGTLFYKVLGPIQSTRTTPGTATFSVPLDLTNGPGTGKHVQAAIWISDIQNPSDSSAAVTDATPTALGAYSTIGASILTSTYTAFTSSTGSWTGFQIECSITQ